jgi:hypothetical protein
MSQVVTLHVTQAVTAQTTVDPSDHPLGNANFIGSSPPDAHPFSRKARCQNGRRPRQVPASSPYFARTMTLPLLSTTKTEAGEMKGIISTGIQAPITEC